MSGNGEEYAPRDILSDRMRSDWDEEDGKLFRWGQMRRCPPAVEGLKLKRMVESNMAQ